MNKKGFSLFYGLMLGLVFILLALSFAKPLKDVTSEARNNEALNCSTTTDNQDKAVCTGIDAMQIFILVIIGLAGIVIGGSLT
jgi:hypothetical protein